MEFGRTNLAPCVFHVHDVNLTLGREEAPVNEGIMSWVGSPGSFSASSAGFIASKLVNHSGSGILLDIVIGIVGAIIGGEIGDKLGLGGIEDFRCGASCSPSSAPSSSSLLYNAVARRA